MKTRKLKVKKKVEKIPNQDKKQIKIALVKINKRSFLFT